MSVFSTSSDKDKEMQDDISGHINLKLFVNEIITHDMIITKNDFKQCELDVNEIIHVVIKKCKQFSEKM